MKVALNQIKIDPTIRIRQNLDVETIERYEEILDQLPPVTVFKTSEGLLLADGFHRWAAAERIGRSEVEADIRPGSRNNALEFAIEANTRHGRPLTRDEYRESVRRLKQLHPDWGLGRIAKSLNRSESFVQKTLAADEVRRRVLRSTLLSDSHLSEIRSAPRELWPDLVRAAEQRTWTRDEVGDVVREIKNEAIPAERKQALLDGKTEPLTEKDGEPAVRRETLERVAAEAKSESLGVFLYGALYQLSNLKRYDPKEVVDRLDEHEVQKLVNELPEYIEFMKELLNIGRERLELWEV